MTWLAAKLFLQGIPLRVWAILAAVALLVASGLYARAHYIGVGESRVQAQWDEREADYALKRAEAAIAARNTEARHRAEYAAIAARFLAEQKEADEKYQTDLASLRDRTLRVRDRLTCPSGRAEAPAGAAGTDGAGQAGLLPEDAGFLLREAARADAIARQLNALIEAVKAGQK